MRIEISHPTSKANFSIVTLGDFEIAFSYSTPIGFARSPSRETTTGTGYTWVTRVNDWGPTTGKHLNELPGRRENRLEGKAFEAALAAALEGLT